MEKKLLKEMCKELGKKEEIIKLEYEISKDLGYDKKEAVKIIKEFYQR